MPVLGVSGVEFFFPKASREPVEVLDKAVDVGNGSNVGGGFVALGLGEDVPEQPVSGVEAAVTEGVCLLGSALGGGEGRHVEGEIEGEGVAEGDCSRWRCGSSFSEGGD